MTGRAPVLAAAVLALAGCGACGDGGSAPDGQDPGRDAGRLDLGAPDTGAPDTGADAGPGDAGAPPPAYRHRPPPDEPPPASLAARAWEQHWVDDIRPYWMQDAALGEPAGNYPTFRTRLGEPARGRAERRPRMMSRQIYAYAMGYLMTGEEALLERAERGVRWMLDHALDPRGGCHARLTGTGEALDGPKYAQDTAYCALGFAAWYFVTRDREAEAALLGLRDLLFEGGFWDEAQGRLRDGLTSDLSRPVDQGDDGGWELVAQLDPINAFLLLSEPVLHDPARRAQFRADLRRLSDALLDHFWEDGIFWGVHDRAGRYRERHVDFGHTLKAYWMLLEVDKRLPDHPYAGFLDEHVPVWIERAFDGERWKKRPVSATADEGGSDWWIYAEAEQIAATWNMGRPGVLTGVIERAASHWRADFVDAARLGGEVISGIRPDGSPAGSWSLSDTFKCNEWKNGYHSTEHALVLHLHGAYLEDVPVELHFAVPPEATETFAAVPYIFHGRETARTVSSTISLPSGPRAAVTVRFVELY